MNKTQLLEYYLAQKKELSATELTKRLNVVGIHTEEELLKSLFVFCEKHMECFDRCHIPSYCQYLRKCFKYMEYFIQYQIGDPVFIRIQLKNMLNSLDTQLKKMPKNRGYHMELEKTVAVLDSILSINSVAPNKSIPNSTKKKKVDGNLLQQWEIEQLEKKKNAQIKEQITAYLKQRQDIELYRYLTEHPENVEHLFVIWYEAISHLSLHNYSEYSYLLQMGNHMAQLSRWFPMERYLAKIKKMLNMQKKKKDDYPDIVGFITNIERGISLCTDKLVKEACTVEVVNTSVSTKARRRIKETLNNYTFESMKQQLNKHPDMVTYLPIYFHQLLEADEISYPQLLSFHRFCSDLVGYIEQCEIDISVWMEIFTTLKFQIERFQKRTQSLGEEWPLFNRLLKAIQVVLRQLQKKQAIIECEKRLVKNYR